MEMILERIRAHRKAMQFADRMRRDINLVGKLTDQELFDRRRPTEYPPPEKVILYTGSYPKDHPYLKMTIDQLMDEDFVRRNQRFIPACWQREKHT